MTYHALNPGNVYLTSLSLNSSNQSNGLFGLGYTDSAILVLVFVIAAVAVLIAIYCIVTEKHKTKANANSAWCNAVVKQSNLSFDDNIIKIPLIFPGGIMMNDMSLGKTSGANVKLRMTSGEHSDELASFTVDIDDNSTSWISDLREGNSIRVRIGEMKNFLFGKHLEVFEIQSEQE